MREPVAITPVNHGVIYSPYDIEEVVLKKDNHLYKLSRKQDSNPRNQRDHVFVTEHRFESMASWAWAGTHTDPLVAIGNLASTMGADFGIVDDGNVVSIESYMRSPIVMDDFPEHVWLEFDRGEAIYLDQPKQLPVVLATSSSEPVQWKLNYNKDDKSFMIGRREDFEQPWEVIDIVDSVILDAVVTLCEQSGIEFASPPTNETISAVWERSAGYVPSENVSFY